LIHDAPPVAELIERIIGDARAIVAERLSGMLAPVAPQ
jgi:nitronate monooxygenase